MKQCPKCSKTYANDKQKFCTKDGTALVDAHQASAGQDTTIRIDSAQLDDEITKVISQPLPRMSERFDPYKTNVSTPPEPPPPAAPSQPIAPPAAPAPPPVAPAPPPVAPAPPPAAPAPPPAAPAPPPVAPPPAPINTGAVQVPSASPSMPESPVASSAPVQPTPPVAPKKRSKLPIVLGILLVLLLIGAGGAVAGYFFVLKPILEKRRVVIVEPRPEPTPIVSSTPDIEITKPEAPKIEVSPYSPPADAVQFVNSNARLTGKLAEHYVDFSFYYPNRWRKDAEAGTANSSNFAKVQRQLAADAPQEIFAVGWYDSTGAKETDDASYPRLVTERSAQFAKTYPEYEKVSEGPVKAGPYDAYEFRFQGVFRKTERGDVQIWGRVMFVPPVEGKRGVTLLMLASSLAPELKSVDDVGLKGELPMMLASFRFGK